MTIDKILKAVHPQIIETINHIRDAGKIEILQEWLKKCEAEIELRGSGDNYALYAEKYYLEMMLAKGH